MSIMIVSQHKSINPWIESFKMFDNNIDIQIYPDITNKDDITFALVWSKNDIDFKEFKNLQCISSMGAGVNHILDNKTILKDVSIVKIVDEKLVDSMWEYLITVVMNVVTNHYEYMRYKNENIWKPILPKTISAFTIGILGLGQLGSVMAQNFNAMNFKVKGYSQSEKELDSIDTTTNIEEFINGVDILINLLPLTEKTQKILNKELLLKINNQGYLINVGRGEHLVESDLLDVIDSNHLRGATLDVFMNEPLSSIHLFWKHPNIMITPHSASITDPNMVTKQIMLNYKRICEGLEPLHKINKDRGY